MRWVVLLLAGLMGCSEPMPLTGFAGSGPAIDPIRFFSGHVRSWGVLEDRSGQPVRSWGVLEDRSGQPTQVVVTDCVGRVEGDTLRMTQTLTIGGDAPVTRTWEMRRAGPGRYEATANDMVGTAVGEASGRAFHWTWTLATSPANALKNVDMDQWWYLLDDGTMLNRTTIRKVGIVLAEVSEHFAPVR